MALLRYNRDARAIEGENPVMPTVTRMRTREQEARFLELDRRVRIELFNTELAEEYNSLRMMSTFTATTVPAIVPTVRTAQQEERFIELESITDPWTPAQTTEYNTLRGLGPYPHPIPPRTYVRVVRDNYGTWNITVRVGPSQRDFPSIAVIKSLINPADKHFLPSRQGRRHTTLRILRNSLEAGLPAQSLHDALRAWVMAVENQVTEAESSIPADGIDPATASLLRAQPATLEVGGKVFRLVPAHESDVRPLITRVRQRTIAQARVETDALRERARTDARVLTTEAERSARRTREEAEAVARRAGVRVPNWVRDSGRPHYFGGRDNGYWHVQLNVNCSLRDIRLLVREWGLVLHWKPIVPVSRPQEWYNEHLCPLWFRLSTDGRYDKHSIFQADWDTPHVGGFMCMDLFARPDKVESIEHLIALEKAISRGMQVVNLNSPISRAVDNYYPALKDQLPVIPIKYLKGDWLEPRAITKAAFKESNPSITWDYEESLVQESNGTFNVDAPVLVLPANTEIQFNPAGNPAFVEVAIPPRRH